MDNSNLQHTFLFILLALLIGEGHGRWKKSNREMLQHDIKLFKHMTEKIKDELGAYYEEYSDEPFADYFFEEIDYLQSKIDRTVKKNTQRKEDMEVNYSHVKNPNNLNNEALLESKIFTKDLPNIKYQEKNGTIKSSRESGWPKFEDILTAMGKKYDWKNDRWIKVKSKTKEKYKIKSVNPKNNVEHQKHNFKYRIVKLNRAKSKRNIVIAVTAIR